MRRTVQFVNGPKFCESMNLLYGRAVKSYVGDGKFVDYEPAGKDIPIAADLMMVKGSQYMIDHKHGTAMFAHSEHPPTVLDFRNNTLHRAEVDQASFQPTT